MSSTGRKQDREASDNYPTPSWCVRRLLEAVTLPPGVWVEPAVGEGAIVKAVDAIRADCAWVTNDVRPVPGSARRSYAHGTASFVGDVDDMLGSMAASEGAVAVVEGALGAANVLITNPPFSLAREFIETSKRLCPKAIRVFLLRLNFLGSEERREWLAADMPGQIWQLPNRQSFVKGKTDSIEYGWFVWYPGTPVRETALRLLALTSLEERKRG